MCMRVCVWIRLFIPACVGLALSACLSVTPFIPFFPPPSPPPSAPPCSTMLTRLPSRPRHTTPRGPQSTRPSVGPRTLAAAHGNKAQSARSVKHTLAHSHSNTHSNTHSHSHSHSHSHTHQEVCVGHLGQRRPTRRQLRVHTAAPQPRCWQDTTRGEGDVNTHTHKHAHTHACTRARAQSWLWNQQL